MTVYSIYEPPNVPLILGKLAAIIVSIILAVAFVPTIVAIPFVQDMGHTATSLIKDTHFEVPLPNMSTLQEPSSSR